MLIYTLQCVASMLAISAIPFTVITVLGRAATRGV